LHPRILGTSLGLIGGVFLTGDFPPKEGFSSVRSPLVGFSFEHALPQRVAVEADGIYHPLVLSELNRSTPLTWEIPVLAKIRFGPARARLFAEAGPALRLKGNTNETSPSVYGGVLGAGIERSLGQVTIAPTLRWVRWAPDPHIARAPNFTNSN